MFTVSYILGLKHKTSIYKIDSLSNFMFTTACYCFLLEATILSDNYHEADPITFRQSFVKIKRL